MIINLKIIDLKGFLVSRTDSTTIKAVQSVMDAGYPEGAGAVLLVELEGLVEEVEEIEIGNITIFLRKAIEEGKFVVVGSTRTRAIKVKR